MKKLQANKQTPSSTSEIELSTKLVYCFGCPIPAQLKLGPNVFKVTHQYTLKWVAYLGPSIGHKYK